MEIVLNMVRKPLKQGEVIFETSEKSDELYLIQSGKVEIRSGEELLLTRQGKGKLFGEMASTMRRKLGDADPVLRALIWNLTNRLADANLMNEEQWQRLKIYCSLSPEDIQKPRACKGADN